MQVIKRVRIEKFRSIHKSDIECSQITTFSGRNNSGKSNVLKALNLFFNDEVSYDSSYDHSRDFNIAFTGHMPGKREIVVTVDFVGVGSAALSKDFSITRRFSSDGPGPFEYHSTNLSVEQKLYPHDGGEPDGNTVRQFTTFKNKVSYIYIPAVRDKAFVARLFKLFELAIAGSSKQTFDDSLSALNSVLEGKSKSINEKFKLMMNLSTRARLSTSPSDVLDSIGIEVDSGISVKKHSGEEQKQFVDLFSTGDGILMSYVPYFLDYIAHEQGNKYFIWGFEEPENSLEYSKTQELADKFAEDFTDKAQIFITTHSPAFINLADRPQVMSYRVFVKPDDKKRVSQVLSISQMQLALFQAQGSQRDLLASEIGMTELAKEIEERIVEVQKQEDVLREQLADVTRPAVFSEGNNMQYLNVAKSLYDPDGEYEFHDGEGKNNLEQAYKHYKNTAPKHKVVVVWDADCANFKSLEKTKMLLPLVLDRCPTNQEIIKGIESSMPEDDIIANRSRFYQSKSTGDGGTIKCLRKPEVAEFFCNEKSDASTFAWLKPTIDKIAEFVREQD